VVGGSISASVKAHAEQRNSAREDAATILPVQRIMKRGKRLHKYAEASLKDQRRKTKAG
jgi:hypothetical protein